MDLSQMTTKQIEHFLIKTKPVKNQINSLVRQKQRTEAIYELAKRTAAV